MEKTLISKMETQFPFFGLMSLLYGMIFAFCMYSNFNGVTFPILIVVTILFGVRYVKKIGLTIQRYTWIYILGMILLAISSFMTTNAFIIFFNWVGIFLLFVVMMIHQFYKELNWSFQVYFRNIIVVIGITLGSIVYPFRHAAAYIAPKSSKQKRIAMYILVGAVIAAGLLLLILPLLVHSDRIFEMYFGNITSHIQFGNIFGICMMALIMCILCYAFFSALCRYQPEEETETRGKKCNPIVGITFTSVIAVIYLFYSVIQIIYLFIGQDGGIPAEITYAEYARSGFWELLFVSIINFLMVLVSIYLFQENKILKGILAIICMCTFIMIFSSAYRMWMYVDVYHLTFLRMFVLWFLGTLTLVMLGTILSIYKKKFPLFRYIMPLQSAGFTKDEIRETLRIVNEYIFDEPLSKSEFDTITRDEAFETNLVPSFYAGKVFLFDEFAKYLVREYHIKRINGALHIYKDGVYVHGYREIERAMIELIPSLAKAKRNEVLDYIEVFVGSESSQADAHLVAFKNGILNVITEELVGFSPDIVITNRIPWDYKPNAKCELVDKSLDKLACGDSAIRALLEECAGYCFYRRNELRKAFIFTGEKANGKSTYIAMISKMLGEENVSSLDFKELGDRFSTETMFRKLANLGDDIDDEFISSSAMFKKLVSGERIKAEKKGQDPFFFVPYVKFIFSANNLPRLRDRTGAVIDRLVVIPFNAKFTKDDPHYRPFIKYELGQQDAIERLIVLGIRGLRRVLEANAFTISSAVEKEIREYDELNNPIQLFFRELNEEDLCRETVAHWYEEYLGFCAANQIKSLSRIEFGRQVLKQFPNVSVVIAKIDGKATRCYRLKLH